MSFKLSIVTEDNYAVLGINGVESLTRVLGSEFDTQQTLSDEFMLKISEMPVFPFGFTPEFKDKFIKMLETQKGKQCIIVDDWLVSYEDANSKRYMEFVKLLNEGKTFDQAKEIIRTNLAK